MQTVNLLSQLKDSISLNRLISAINGVSFNKSTMSIEAINGFLQNVLEQNPLIAQQSQALVSQLLAINELTIDSRKANAQSVFMALLSNISPELSPEPGKLTSRPSNDGHQYIQSAVNASCRLVLSECQLPNEHLQLALLSGDASAHIALQISVYQLRDNAGQLAKAFYFDDADASKACVFPTVTAVTGTNGKTSIASLLAQWMSLLGHSSASIGTLGVNKYLMGTASKMHETLNTTPDVVSMFTYLAQLSQTGSQQIAIEASSHGLAQKRLLNVDIDCAVFSNLSQDHLDYHKTMQDYGAAKRLLLQSPHLRYAVLNADDPQSRLWCQDIQNIDGLADIEPVFFSVQDKGEPVNFDQIHNRVVGKAKYCIAKNLVFTPQGCEFDFVSSWGNQAICLPLIGRFNVANFLAAAAALLVQSFEFSALMNQVENLSGVSGRMELFGAKIVNNKRSQKNVQQIQYGAQKTAQKSGEMRHNKANILVDYAHTPDALCQALVAAKQHTTGQLICVFGCGGDRDKTKRAQMGAIANEHADIIVLTQDNSRAEQPSAIIADILQGITCQQKVHIELDRKQAIKEAWLNSRAQDLILLAGKGHETYMEIDNQRIEYDERAFVNAMLKEYTPNSTACEGTTL